MAPNFFKNCPATDRFTGFASPSLSGNNWTIYDWDQRRMLRLYTPNIAHIEAFIFDKVASFMDDLAVDIVRVDLDSDGNTISLSSDPTLDMTDVPYYPPLADFPPNQNTVWRQQLTEVGRLGRMVDLATYRLPGSGQSKTVVFKYSPISANRSISWHEMNCILRIPSHPSIVPLDALVLERDETDGRPNADKVVGFTTPYVQGGTLQENLGGRLFKLQHLRQLIEVVDWLNLRLGIVHGDLCPANILIDPDTDFLKLFDFGRGAKLGWDGDDSTWGSFAFAYDPRCNDVTFAVYAVYAIITHEFSWTTTFNVDNLDVGQILSRKWKLHPDPDITPKLDHPVDDYCRVLLDWVKRREVADNAIRYFTNAPEYLDWPLVPDIPKYGIGGFSIMLCPGQFRFVLKERGVKFVEWLRPPTCLLATGDIVNR